MTTLGKMGMPDVDVFGTFWDVAIVGAGYSGFAAALAASAAGKKTLLVDPGCSLLWESGLARNPEAGKMPPEMQPFMHRMECATGIAEDWIDPGSAEWVANGLLLSVGVERLYFATPVAVEPDSAGQLQTVTFALLDRLATVSAATWIDATEDALLARLCGVPAVPQSPIKRIYRFFVQRTRWPLRFPFDLFTGIYGSYARMEESGWSSEKIVRLEAGNACKVDPVELFEPHLKVMRKRLDGKCPDAPLTHWSWAPYPLYAKLSGAVASPFRNLALAIPALSATALDTLGDRALLGATAYARVANGGKPAKKPSGTPKPKAPAPALELNADVCVAGLGTAGVMAAVAAARGGARTLAIEAAAFPGGTSTGGGVRSYHLGCSGGIQDELDAATRNFMQSAALVPQGPGCYHGLARLAASHLMLAKAKVDVRLGARVIPGSASVSGGRIESVLAATPAGIAKISAPCWIDATGNADLAAAAGLGTSCPGEKGAPANPAAQFWGTFKFDAREKLVPSTPPGAPFTPNPSDSVSMTRARISSIAEIADSAGLAVSNSFSRCTGIAPLPAVRQGRTAKTRYAVSLDDLAERRTFDDAIGFTAGTLGLVDPEAAWTDRDLAFYVWCCGMAGAETACEIPYRAILADGADNLWIAGKGAGATPQAIHQFRMMRDAQRLGEAAGVAAALAAKLGVTSAEVPKQRLTGALVLTGALAPWRPKKGAFGEAVPSGVKGDPVFSGPATASNAKKWVAAIGGPDGPLAMWRLYRLGVGNLPKEAAKLLSAKGAKGDAAALLLGALGVPGAEARLAAMAAAGDPDSKDPQATRMRKAAAWLLSASRQQAPAKKAAAKNRKK